MIARKETIMSRTTNEMEHEIKKDTEEVLSTKKTNNTPNRGGRRGRNQNTKRRPRNNANFKGAVKKLYDARNVLTDGHANNDVAWYNKIPGLLAAVASIAFNIPVGSPFKLGRQTKIQLPNSGNSPTMSSVVHEKVVPGIFTIDIVPTLGQEYDDINKTTTNPNSGANIAAQQLFSLDRKANSSLSAYDKTDLFMVVYAMDSAYMLFEELCRGFRSLSKYNYLSRYMPETLSMALGYSTNLAKEYRDFAGLINLFAYKLASIPIPDQFSFIHRHSWLFTHVYKDSEDDRAQLYAYVPHGYYVWQEGVDNKASYLKYMTRQELFGDLTNNVVENLDEIETAINMIMNPLLGSSDVGYIAADLMKAFGEGGMIKLQEIKEDEVLNPVFDMEVVHQMMNSTIYETDVVRNDITVNYQNTLFGPYFECVPRIRASIENAGQAVFDKILNMHGVEISAENTMVSTRLMSNVDASSCIEDASDPDGGLLYAIKSNGTEIAVNAKMWFNGTLSAPGGFTPFHQVFMIQDAATPTANMYRQLLSNLPSIYEASNFDYAPTIYVGTYSGANGSASGPIQESSVAVKYWIQDLDKYVTVSDETVRRLNNIAVMSEYAAKDYPVN